MTLPDKNRQVFIVRIWREMREIKGAWPEWRGEIECVDSGEQRYLKSLDEITAFIAPYLTKMGVKLAIWWRVRRWLKHRRQPLSRQE